MSNHIADTNKMGKPETYLTIQADVLSTIVGEKAHDPQATKIRELQAHIKRAADLCQFSAVSGWIGDSLT